MYSATGVMNVRYLTWHSLSPYWTTPKFWRNF